MDEINVELIMVKVDAGSLESTINKILEEKEKDELNKDVPDDTFWANPLKDQIDALSKKWTDPKSDGSGGIVHMWRSNAKIN